ncbi:hypothetical protein [Georgenia yuyongxinii]|uniref:hypothetical protein n=1 Tax=Georgenia yuyongxinii TaxID=2589797 RepID=UPI001E4DCDEB|nr:hypothetical protein [Georgenia yuyongxinii]
MPARGGHRGGIEAPEFLESKGIALSGDQQTKTKAALRFFAAELQAQEARPTRVSRLDVTCSSTCLLTRWGASDISHPGEAASGT